MRFSAFRQAAMHRFAMRPAFTLAFVAAALVSTAASAARIDIRTLTCAQVRGLVQQQGSIVLTFTNTTYDRVVRNRNFCARDEGIKPFFKQTLDMPLCQIGFECVRNDELLWKY